ncbi:hypothetical protein [Leuconostoc pseudomesenteroides]|uniref:hypothetical protein n=1 Tax=Leuconostoc pseudomesenteroides TaxID=33968 RepID=UPI0021A4B865|nr:hypothetical protein [Leuconostoc pseudomesenteroides]MCT4380613.1 hypothetical protein [Leuconostoc pseudomesenteroides]
MKIEDFVKQFVSKNNITFKILDKFDSFDDVEKATKEFKKQNPAKEIPEGYVITNFVPDKFIELINLDTLVEVSIEDKNKDFHVGVFENNNLY